MITTDDLMKKHDEFEAIDLDDLRFRCFEVNEIRTDIDGLRDLIKMREERIRQVETGNASKDKDETQHIGNIKKWLAEEQAEIESVKPVLDLIGTAEYGWLLVEMARGEGDDERQMNSDLGDWYLRRPLIYFKDDHEAQRAEAFFNAAAILQP